MEEQKTAIFVMRCSERPAAVPSIVVTCNRCGEACWYDRQGLPLLEQHPDAEFVCMVCAVPLILEYGEEAEIRQTTTGMPIPKEVGEALKRWTIEKFGV